jgi:hypothetical protein
MVPEAGDIDSAPEIPTNDRAVLGSNLAKSEWYGLRLRSPAPESTMKDDH